MNRPQLARRVLQHRCEGACRFPGRLVVQELASTDAAVNPDGVYAVPPLMCVDTHVELYHLTDVTW